MEKVFKALGILVLVLALVCFQLYVIQEVWNLLVAPRVKLPNIDMSGALGLSIFVSVCAANIRDNYKEKAETEDYVKYALGLLITLGIAHLIA